MKMEYYLDKLSAEVNKVTANDTNQKLRYGIASGVIWGKALVDEDISKEEYGIIVNETHVKLELRLQELR